MTSNTPGKNGYILCLKFPNVEAINLQTKQMYSCKSIYLLLAGFVP